MLPAEVCSLRRAAEDLNRFRIEHKDTNELANAQSALALKISQARSWDISWQCIGKMIGVSAVEAEELFDSIKECQSQVTNLSLMNSRYQGADCLKRAAENLFKIEGNHASESEIAEARIELIHRMSKATAWDISWPLIGEIIGISRAEAEDLFDRITEAAERSTEAVETAGETAPPP